MSCSQIPTPALTSSAIATAMSSNARSVADRRGASPLLWVTGSMTRVYHHTVDTPPPARHVYHVPTPMKEPPAERAAGCRPRPDPGPDRVRSGVQLGAPDHRSLAVRMVDRERPGPQQDVRRGAAHRHARGRARLLLA